MAVAATPGEPWRAYAPRLLEVGAGADPAAVMAGVVAALAAATGWPVPPGLRLSPATAPATVAGVAVPAALADAALLGRAHEALLAPAHRRRAGAHYTPAPIAGGLVGWATTGWHRPAGSVCDPAVGGGAFLLAAASWLHGRGHDPGDIVRRRLWGADVDPLAVAVTEAALAFWAWRAGDRTGATPGPGLAVGDTLRDGAGVWSGPPAAGFDLVIGNPPFRGQLNRATARSAPEAASLRRRLGAAASGYADTAALFLLSARAMTAPEGRIALIQPATFFAARDVAGIRTEVLRGARLEAVWVAGARVFDAQVRVGAVVLEVDADPPDEGPRPVRRAKGAAFEPLAPAAVGRETLGSAPSWSFLSAPVHGTPPVTWPEPTRRLGELVTATAGFRGQYYGLVPFVEEAVEPDDDRPRLVTTGLIDPVHCRWGEAPARFAGRSWTSPVVDLDGVGRADPALGRWLQRMLVPKVMVATQTRVVEAIVDDDGTLVPSVPVVAVHASQRRLWEVAAVLHAPVVSAWALHRAGGTARTADAIKLSAAQVLEIPVPADAGAWAAAADALRADGPGEGFALAIGRAYGMADDDPVRRWWLDRRPRRADPVRR